MGACRGISTVLSLFSHLPGIRPVVVVCVCVCGSVSAQRHLHILAVCRHTDMETPNTR